MKRAFSVSASALLGAALTLSAAAPRSLYSAPPKESATAVSEEPAPASAAAEEKFRKLQKEMQSAPGQGLSPLPGPSAPSPREETSAGGLALQILFGLAFVLILAVVSIRFLKRMQRGLLAGPRGGGDMLEVLETCHLGAQQKIVALRMHDEVGVLGVTKEGIRLLTVLKQPAAELRNARGESNPAAFSDNLNKLLDRFKKPKKVSDMLDEAEG